ncbi:hypothetical protein ACFQE1_06940 [Halobium palmae]|uniref:DUF8173 domain-containing protein n=1 Tax=Halobium palmae TaxID=1776492 RepID=A0ABD5RYM6_9EURY
MVSRRALRTVGTASAALTALVGTAVAQQPPAGPQLSLVTRLGIGLVVNLVVGAIVVAAVPDYVRSTADRIHDDPGGSFGWGLLAFIGLIVASVLIVTVIVTIPLLLILGLVGGSIATVAVGQFAVDVRRDGDLWKALGVGVVALVLVGLVPIVGGVVNFVVGMLGGGAMVNEFRANRSG